MGKPASPDDGELLAFLDGELPPPRQAEIRQLLENDWSLRVRLEELERDVATYVSAARPPASSDLPPFDDLWRRVRACAAQEPEMETANANVWVLQRERMRALLSQPIALRLALSFCLVLLLTAGLAFWLLRSDRMQTVSAEELVQRATQSEARSLQRVGDPVIYRKVQLRRGGTAEAVQWESWKDARPSGQFRQRIASQKGGRLLRERGVNQPVLLTELETILRANQFDAERPLSAASFAAWRKQLRQFSDTLTEQKDNWRLTTSAAAPHSLNTIIAASLLVRKADWHALALQLTVQGEHETREYELSELAYDVLPLQALTVFADLAPPPAASTTPTTAPSMIAAMASPAPPPAAALPTTAALQEAEVAALYALHQLKADLGEQLEVVREADKQIVVRGLVQSAARKAELVQALRRIALVSPQILTIEEAVQQTQRAAPAAHETVLATNESTVTSSQSAAAVNPFQQKLIEQFGGCKGLTEAERAEVSARVTQFYNAVEADASAALAAAWALRRLQERFATTTGAEMEETARLRLAEMQNNHLARLRQHARNLQARLHPLLASFAGDAPAVWPNIEPTRQARLLAVFRSIEQTHRLTDQLIASNTTTLPPQFAQAFLTELMRFDIVLAALEKN